MSTPTGDNAFLRELELHVRTELILAETSQPGEEAVGVPIDEWLSDRLLRVFFRGRFSGRALPGWLITPQRAAPRDGRRSPRSWRHS